MNSGNGLQGWTKYSKIGHVVEEMREIGRESCILEVGIGYDKMIISDTNLSTSLNLESYAMPQEPVFPSKTSSPLVSHRGGSDGNCEADEHVRLFLKMCLQQMT